MKVLGVLIDDKLIWDHHVLKVIKSCRSAVSFEIFETKPFG